MRFIFYESFDVSFNLVNDFVQLRFILESVVECRFKVEVIQIGNQGWHDRKHIIDKELRMRQGIKIYLINY